MLRWLFLCYQSHASLVIRMLPLSCSIGFSQLPLFHVILGIHMLPLSYASLVIPMLPESCFIGYSHATTVPCSIAYSDWCNNHVMLPRSFTATNVSRYIIEYSHVTSMSIHMLHQWVFTCYINWVFKCYINEFSHVTSMSIHMLHQWVFTCYINEYSHVTSMSIHMLHQWVFTCYIEYSHVVIKLCFFGYSYATWVMFHLSFSWYQWHNSLVIQMQQLCHAYSHAANMQSLLVSYMRCYCDNMI
jgi:hypothetical protein